MVHMAPPLDEQVRRTAVAVLEPALEISNGRTEAEHLMKLVDKGDAQLWSVMKSHGPDIEILAYVVTEGIRYETGKKALRVAAGGWADMKPLRASRGSESTSRLHDWLPQLEEIAKRHGFGALEIQGRHGWRKVFPEYQELYTLMTKEL